MKPYLQAKPQLRGPNGLRNWYAQLPVVTYSDHEPTAILPIEGLLRPSERLISISTAGSAPARRRWSEGVLVTGLLFLLSKKLYYKNLHPDPVISGPWLRRVLGASGLLLAGSGLWA